MEEREVVGIKVDGCQRCGGVWFDRAELMALARAGRAAVAEAEADFKAKSSRAGSPGWSLRCPVCGDVLRRFEYKNLPGLQFDGCDKCNGIWVEEGELAALAEKLGLA